MLRREKSACPLLFSAAVNGVPRLTKVSTMDILATVKLSGRTKP